MDKKIKILIVDDHNMFLEGIVSLIEDSNDITIINTANDGLEALNMLAKETPDVIITDLEMPNMDGIKFTKAVTTRYPNIKIIALTSHSNPSMLEKAKKYKMHGYLLKKTSKIELLKAIYSVYNGEYYFTPEVTAYVKQHGATKNNDVLLSPREKQVLRLICEEKSTQEIANDLYISKNTVESHRKNLMRKLGAKNMVGLVKYAISHNLI